MCGENMLENIKNNSIIICNNLYKEQILRNLKKLINIKFMSMDEFIKSYYFDYDEKTILYLIKKYNIKYDLALEYLNNLIYVEDKIYNSPKLDYLVNLKKELSSNNLLIVNTKFKDYIKDKDIIIYKYELSKQEKYLLKNINYKVISKKYNNYIPSIYGFNDIESEVEYVALNISKLIDKKVDIRNIKLTNVTEEYINVIEKIFSFYNLKISKHNNIPIMSTIIGNTFYKNLNNGISEAINSIENYSNTTTYNKIINICNKYLWVLDNNDLKILIEYDLNNTYIENIKYTNEIEVVDYKNYEFTSEYVFMLGFNQGIIPKIKKDEDYINDYIKLEYMDTLADINIKEKEITIKSIKNIKNLTITYKLKTAFNSFYPSSLIDEMNLSVEFPSLDLSVSYSDISNSLRLSKYLDDLIKYGVRHDNLSILNSNYDIPYNTYSSSFTGISLSKINNYMKSLKEFNLSYSSMDNYNRCAFRFYIEKILTLKNSLDKFSVTIGNIYHYILELAINKDIDISKEVYKYIKEKEITLNKSNEFFIKKAIKDMKYLISIIKMQNSYSKMDNIKTEKYIKVNIKDNINFVGFIDKIMYKKENNSIIASIIDYKTYIKKPSLKYSKSGIGLQLPTYMYLAKKHYENIRFVGFYMQNILFDNKSDDEKMESLKLIGYTNTDREILKYFDYNYMNSNVIAGIKVNTDGSFSSNSLKNMLNDQQILNLIDLTEEKINDTVENILSAKFDINPKYDKQNIGCEFCSYKDLCFMNESNFEKIEE